MPPPRSSLIQQIIATGSAVAIALGGSHASGTADTGSDNDIYVLTSSRINPDERRRIASRLADDPDKVEVDIPYWGDEDAYQIDGVWYDIAYFDAAWFFAEIDTVVNQHQARQGYTTSFVHTLANMQPFYDPSHVLADWKARVTQYPGPLAEAIIAVNYPVSCTIHACYRNQIARAISLGDDVAVNHRVAAFLACIFDIAFAVLRIWHPGEKRQMQYLDRFQDTLPPDFTTHITDVVQNTSPDRLEHLMPAIDRVVADVTAMIRR